MRRFVILFALLLTTIGFAIPVGAQDDAAMDIVDTAVADGRFGTLVAAVEAAGLVDTLKSDGPFTVFAPTDDAFAALPEGTVEGLLEDTEALTDVLLYHVVEGAVSAETVVTLDSATTVQGADVSIAIVDGGVVMNDSVNVIITDIETSNGIIHVIDGVLLPPMDEDMAGDMMVEEVAVGNIRVAHFSPDTPAVEVYVNGELSDIQTLEFGNVTGWVELPVGTYDFAVAPAGTSIDDAAIRLPGTSIPENAWITVAAVGSLEAGTLTAQLLPEDFSPLDEGTARIAVFHAIEDAPAVDVLAGDTPVITNLGYPGTLGDNDGFTTVTVPADTYDLFVVPTGATEPVVIDLSGTDVEADTYYLVAAIGTLDDPGVALATTAADVVMSDMMMDDEMSDDMMGEDMADEDMSDDMSDMGNIPEVATDAGDFSTLLAAVEAAGLADTLATDGPFTLFAPTNAAFETALSNLGITAEELLADTELLTQVLLYHVIEGEVMASQVVGLDSAITLEGSAISIEVVDDGVVINGSVNVIMTDVEASNGVIHVIDGVLLPQ